MDVDEQVDFRFFFRVPGHDHFRGGHFCFDHIGHDDQSGSPRLPRVSLLLRKQLICFRCNSGS